LNIFKEKEKGNFAKIGDVDVIVKLIQLPENTVDTVQRVADDVSAGREGYTKFVDILVGFTSRTLRERRPES
jgi:predicted nucleic acid-binding OB-fold protein